MTKVGLKQQTSVPPFEQELAAWLNGEVSCLVRLYGLFSNKEFLAWNKRTVELARETLAKLYLRHGVRPSTVMNILSYGWLIFLQEECYFGDPRLTWLKTSRKRKSLLNRIHKVIEALKSLKGRYQVPVEEAEKIRDFLEKLPVPKAHRPKDDLLRWCAGNLSDLFERITSNSLYENIGELLGCAFADRWNPAASRKEAAKKIIKRRPRQTFIAPQVVKTLKAARKGSAQKGLTPLKFIDPIVAHSLMIQEGGLNAITSPEALGRFLSHNLTPVQPKRK